jgi:glycosyltransferase involved in cell wall biosynthesis
VVLTAARWDNGAVMAIAAMVQVGAAGKGRPDRVLPPAARTRRRPHVCFVAPYVWPVLSRDPAIQVVGGAEVQQAILARLLAAEGYPVSMICLDYGQPSPTVVDGVTVHKAFKPDEGIPVLRFVHPRLSSIWRLMQEIDADVYYQRSSAVWTGVMAEFCRRRGKRSIYAGASDRDFVRGEEQIKLARDRWIYQHGLAAVDAVVAQNPYQVRSCLAHHGRVATHIPSCYVLPKDAGVLKPEFVLWVGTIHDYKRPEMLLELAQRLPHRRFVMIGGPSVGGERFKPGYFESIREKAKALPNVEFKGFLPLAQVEPWFDRARVLVCTSVYEGMPNIFLQAWARGVPTIATVDVGVAANQVFASLEDAAALVERHFKDEAHWRAASGRCLTHFESTHSAAHVLEQYGRLLERLAPRTQPA